MITRGLKYAALTAIVLTKAEVTAGGGARAPQHPHAAVPSIGLGEVEASRGFAASDTGPEEVSRQVRETVDRAINTRNASTGGRP
jgi:hypothetical protein